jgi:hypothetical protein
MISQSRRKRRSLLKMLAPLRFPPSRPQRPKRRRQRLRLKKPPIRTVKQYSRDRCLLSCCTAIIAGSSSNRRTLVSTLISLDLCNIDIVLVEVSRRAG